MLREKRGRGILVVIMAVLASLVTAATAMASGALPEEPARAEERPEEGAPIPEEVLQRIDALFARCLEVLNRVLDKVAEEARHAIERAIGLVTKAREFLASLKVPAKWAIEPGRPGFAYPGRGAPESPEEGSLLMPTPDKVPEDITVPDWVPEGMVHDQRDLPGLPARPGRE